MIRAECDTYGCNNRGSGWCVGMLTLTQGNCNDVEDALGGSHSSKNRKEFKIRGRIKLEQKQKGGKRSRQLQIRPA